MSVGGVGIILSLPLAPVAAPVLLPIAISAVGIAIEAAAVAVAGVGVVVVLETGKATVACGNELKKMAKENLAMQQKLQTASQQYEAQLMQQEHELLQMRQDQILNKLAQHQQAMHARAESLKTVRTWLNQPVAAPAFDAADFQAMREDLLATAPPSTTTKRELLSGWAKKMRQTRVFADYLTNRLQQFTSGNLQGLFKTASLEQVAEETRQMLTELETQAEKVLLVQAPPDTGRYEQVRINLALLDRRIDELHQQRPQRQQQRQNALIAIEQAQQAVQKAATAVETGAQFAGLQVAEETLDDAINALYQGEFTRARGAADAVQSHLQTLEQTVLRQRQRNLTLTLQRLRQQIEPLGTLDALKPPVDVWLTRCVACETMCEQDMIAAWQMISGKDGLSVQAEQLQHQALHLLIQHNTATLTTLAHDALQTMGYQVEINRDSEGLVNLTGRQDDRRVYVALSEDGTLAMHLEGFGNSSCQTVLQQFLNHLHAQGIEATWQQQFTLSEASQRMVGMLQTAGLDVKTEMTDEGITILANGQVNAFATIDYDGRAYLSNELQRFWQQKVRTQATEVSHVDMEQEWVQLQEQHQRMRAAMLIQEQRT